MSNETTVRGARRAMILAVIGSLAVAAVIGIVILLGGGFGELERHVLLTALAVAAFATTALCHLVVVTRAVRVVGVVGLAAGVGAVVCALVLIWSEDQTESVEMALFTGLAVTAVVAASLAQTNLLLLLLLLLLANRTARRPHPAVVAALVVTLLAVATVATMLIVPIFAENWFGDLYTRWFGVAAIVDALGTIALPVLALVLRRASDSTVVTTVHLELDLPTDLAARLDARASTGSREAAALEALAGVL